MRPKEFEKYLGSSLKKYHSKVDAEKVWKDVLPHLDAQPRRRFPVWMAWLVLFLGLGLTTGAALWWMPAQTQTTTHAAELLQTSDGTVNATSAKTVRPSTQTLSSISQIAKTTVPPLKTIPGAKTKTTDLGDAPGQPLPTNKQIKSHAGLSISSQDALPPTPGQVANKPGLDFGQTENTLSLETVDPTIVLNTPETAGAREELVAGLPVENKKTNHSEGIESLHLLPNALIRAETEEDYISRLYPASKRKQCYAFSDPNSPTKLEISVFAGIFSAGKNLNALTTDDQTQAYVNARRETEKNLETINAGVLFGLRHESGFYLRTGAEYTQINEQFDYRLSFTDYDTIPNGITEIHINQLGDTSFVYGDVPVTRNYSYEKRTFNNFTLIDIPLIVGYQLPGELLSFSLEGGAFLNVALQNRGTILSPTLTPQSLEESPGSNYFNASVGLGYYGAFYVQTAVSEHMTLYAGPAFKFYPKNFLKGTIPIEQSYTVFGMKLGATYRF